MPTRRLPSVPCPHARPDDGCRLAPGVRYCVCHGGEARDVVGHVVVRDGQLFWIVRSEDGRELGGYTYLAVTTRGAGLEPVELEGDVELHVRHDAEGRKPCYVVRARSQRAYEIDAAALLDAACDGREWIECRPHESGAA